jgi:hypothetical protein
VGIGLWLVIAGGADLVAAGVFHLTFKPMPIAAAPPHRPVSTTR